MTTLKQDLSVFYEAFTNIPALTTLKLILDASLNASISWRVFDSNRIFIIILSFFSTKPKIFSTKIPTTLLALPHLNKPPTCLFSPYLNTFNSLLGTEVPHRQAQNFHGQENTTPAPEKCLLLTAYHLMKCKIIHKFSLLSEKFGPVYLNLCRSVANTTQFRSRLLIITELIGQNPHIITIHRQ